MTNWTIATSWVGEYTYDDPDACYASRRTVGFTFQGQLGWFGRFRGAIEDDPEIGAEPATARGLVWGNRVRFRKQYDPSHVYLDGAHVPVKTHWARIFGVRLLADPPPRTVWYEGEYDPDRGVFEGTWRTFHKWSRLRTETRVFYQVETAGTGTWSMWRDGS